MQKTMKGFIRVLSVVLTLTLLVGAIPIQALAAERSTEETQIDSETSEMQPDEKEAEIVSELPEKREADMITIHICLHRSSLLTAHGRISNTIARRKKG